MFACPGSLSNQITNRSNLFFNPDKYSPEFENSTLGIKIIYPADWRYVIYGNNTVELKPIFDGGEEPIVTDYLKISVNHNHSSYIIPPHSNTIVLESYHLLHEGIKFGIKPIIISGHPAIKSEFYALRYNEGPCPSPIPVLVNIANIYINSENILYTIEYKTPQDIPSISTLQMTIQKMIDSFQIIDSQ